MASGKSEKFHIKWDNMANSPSFRDIWEKKEMMDVSLACEGEELRAHKVVLAACSPKLESILRKYSNQQNPTIILWGMKLSLVKAIISFMYQGEVQVDMEELDSFLKIALELEVKGLNEEPQGKDVTSSAATKPISRSDFSFTVHPNSFKIVY